MGGVWQNVWGQIHPREIASQTALRELHEETGLRPTKFYQLNTVNTFYLAKDDCTWHCPCFCAVVPGEVAVLLNDEYDAFRWLAHEDYLKQIMWPGERLAAAELCREILDHGPSEPYLHIHL